MLQRQGGPLRPASSLNRVNACGRSVEGQIRWARHAHGNGPNVRLRRNKITRRKRRGWFTLGPSHVSMSELSILLSPEVLAEQLGKAAGDALLENELLTRDVVMPREAVSAFTDVLIEGGSVGDVAAVAKTWRATESVAAFEELRPRVESLLRNFRLWLRGTFRAAKDRLTALAEKILELAKETGSSIEGLLSNLYRRAITVLVQMSVPMPITVGGNESVIQMLPKSVDVSYKLKASLSIPTPDVAGIVKFLSNLANVELSLSVKLGPA